MLSTVIAHGIGGRDSSERKSWNSEAWTDLLLFLAQSLALVGGAIFLYALGSAIGMTLIAVCLAVGLLLRSQIASDEQSDSEEDGGHGVALDSLSHCTNPIWLRTPTRFPRLPLT